MIQSPVTYLVSIKHSFEVAKRHGLRLKTAYCFVYFTSIHDAETFAWLYRGTMNSRHFHDTLARDPRYIYATKIVGISKMLEVEKFVYENQHKFETMPHIEPPTFSKI